MNVSAQGGKAFSGGAHAMAAAVRDGRVCAGELARASLALIASGDVRLHAFLAVDGEGARTAARRVDEAREGGALPGPLAGVPVAVKDNLCTRGFPTGCASRILEGWRPPYDATVVERLRAAGALVVGKTNLDEFAMGSSTENSAYGPTRNPWDHDRVPGGSSGGSAAAVAAGFVPLALGSDTGGSVRQPASFCGVVGYKPSYGRVSRHGLVAFASSLDCVGVFARTVADCALGAGVIAGHDALDSTCWPDAVPDFSAAAAGRGGGAAPTSPVGLRVGLPREHFGAVLDAGVGDIVQRAADVLRAQGAELVEVALPRTEHAIAAYYLVATAEASANLARYDGVRYGSRDRAATTLLEMLRATRGKGFGPEVKRRIMLGTYALSAGYYDAYYLRAQKVRALLCQDFRAAFERCDILLGPATPTAAFRLGEKAADPLAMYLSDVYTCPANLSGIPALVVPAGRTAEGLPVGVQLMAPAGRDEVVFAAGGMIERALGPAAAAPARGGAA